MKKLIFIIPAILLIISCADREPVNEMKAISSEEFEQKVANSTEFEDMVAAADLMTAKSPSPLHIEEFNEWNQIFTDFHEKVGDDRHFSYYIDNPDFDTPEEVREHYLLLIDFQEKVMALKEKFDLTDDEFRKIFSENRKPTNYIEQLKEQKSEQ